MIGHRHVHKKLTSIGQWCCLIIIIDRACPALLITFDNVNIVYDYVLVSHIDDQQYFITLLVIYLYSTSM